MWALYICIFIVIYGRMIEIYLVTSVAPIPMATMMGKEWGLSLIHIYSRESKKTQHKGEAQKRKGQRQRGGSQRFLLCFQCIPGKFPFGSK